MAVAAVLTTAKGIALLPITKAVISGTIARVPEYLIFYGEFAGIATRPNVPILNGHACPYYRGWDLDFYDTAGHAMET